MRQRDPRHPGGECRLYFTRVAASPREAILSAIRDVRRAGIAADVWRVDGADLGADEVVAAINRDLEAARPAPV